MSLKFLSKKSWHTTNIKNVEKVWIAEETAAKEQKKLAELQKQIQEERQIQELRELQVASGQAVKNTDTTMDWMYEGPAAQQQQSGEDFLLGKVYKSDATGSGTAGVDLRKERDPGSLWMNKTSSKNDSFTRLHEDPLLAIRKQEKTVREDIIHNPVKMARIKHRIAEDMAKLEEKKSKKEKKILKDHKEKKSKKDKKESKHSRSEKGDQNEDDESRSRDRSHDRTADRNHRRQRGSSPRQRSRSRDQSADRHLGYKRSRSRDRNRRSHSPRDRSRRSRSRSGDRSRSRSGDRRRRIDSSERGVSRQSTRDRSLSPPQREKRPQVDRKEDGKAAYGLVKRGGSDQQASAGHRQTGLLGPNADLLKKKEAADAEKSDWRKRLNKDGAKRLTEEEKLQRIAEMERDANLKDHQRSVMTEKLSSKHRDQETTGNDGSAPNADFIKSMRSEVYNNKELDSSAAMEERMRRNRHYQQSSSDFDKGFMKM